LLFGEAWERATLFFRTWRLDGLWRIMFSARGFES